jgi:hypothetical protein
MKSHPHPDQSMVPESKPDVRDELKSLPMVELQDKLGALSDGLSHPNDQGKGGMM